MARGGKRGHKGGSKRFTNPEALEQQRIKAEKEKAWRRQRGIETDSSEEGSGDEDDESTSDSGDGIAFDRSGSGASKTGDQKKATSSNESDEEASDDEPGKPKGAEGVIETANPNMVQAKTKKVSELDGEAERSSKPQLSRREREEIEKLKAKANYQKLHAAGKTEEAKADLARLAIVRKQREDAAKKRDMEAKAKEEVNKAKKAATVALKKGKK